MRLFIRYTPLMFLLASTLLPGISSAAETQDNSWKAPPEFSERSNPIKIDNESIKKGRRYLSNTVQPATARKI